MKTRKEEINIAIRGAGELASAAVRRLALAGFRVIALEKAEPECVRRAVCFAEAVYDGEVIVEGVAGVLAKTFDDAEKIIRSGRVPIFIDPDADCVRNNAFDFVIDARMLKRGIETTFKMAPIVIGLGPGFTVGKNCHAAVETNRGANLGRVLYERSTSEDTGIPAAVDGKTVERVLRSPADGIFHASGNIGDRVEIGSAIGNVAGLSVKCEIGGILRGIIRDGTHVGKGQKIGDIDPRGIREYCFKISDKANAVAGGVMEAVLYFRRKKLTGD